MNIDVAVEILRSMAQGIHPLSGEKLSPDSVCNEVEVVRALYCVIEELEQAGIVTKPRKYKSARSDRPRERRGRAGYWTLEYDDDLCRMFDEGYSLKNMEDYFGRNKKEIIARLRDLGKVRSNEVIE